MSKTALLFPGQGAQGVGMGKDFVERFDTARKLFDRAGEVLGYDLGKLCLEGPDEELTLTRHCQPAIYLVSSAIVACLEESGRLDRSEITATAGLSLGEYTALHFAGVFGFEDGLRLVARRGALMQGASDDPPSGMVSLIGADPEQAAAVAAKAAEGEVLSVANLLSPGQVVLSGTKTALARVPAVAKELGVRRAIPLNVAGAFHSALMQPAAEELGVELAKVDFQTARVPVYVNVSGRPLREPDEIRAALRAQIVEPVQWVAAMTRMIEDGIESFLEPGPGRVLTGLMRKIDSERRTENLDTVEA